MEKLNRTQELNMLTSIFDDSIAPEDKIKMATILIEHRDKVNNIMLHTLESVKEDVAQIRNLMNNN